MIDLNDLAQNNDHYKQANGRVPGLQVTANWGLDVRQNVIKDLIPEDANSILDLGAADGSLLILLHKAGKLNLGAGVDLWTEGIKWGNEYCKANQLPIILSNESVETYNGPSTDVTILGEILEHVVDPVKVLRVASTKSPTVIITVPIARPPLSDDEKAKLLIEPDEHIRQYDRYLLAMHCMEANLRIENDLMVGSGWENLIVLAKRM